MSSRLSIAVVGLNFGRQIIKQLTQGPAAEILHLVAVCDRDRVRAEAVAEKNACKAYYDLEDVLADPAIPAIGLYTGPAGRADLIRRCLEAGKDVMTTKPLENDPQAALTLLRDAQKMGRVVHCNSPTPILPANLAQIQAWRQQYALGRAVACRADTWVSYREKENGTWYDDPKLCPVAPILRLGIYLINDLASLFGVAKSVHVQHSRVFTGRPTPDNAQLGILFENGALANVFASFCVDDGDKYRNALTLNFENGTVYRNVGPAGGDSECELSLVIDKEDRRIVAARSIAGGHNGDYQWEAFARAVRGEDIGETLTPEEMVSGLQILEAMGRADASRGAAEIKPLD